MTKAEIRAVKIVELQEELAEAKRIIGEFVWPGDSTTEQHQVFVKQAARFAGVTAPVYKDTVGSEMNGSVSPPNAELSGKESRTGEKL